MTLREKRAMALGRAMRLELLGYEQHARRLWTRVERITRTLERRDAERAAAGAEYARARREALGRQDPICPREWAARARWLESLEAL